MTLNTGGNAENVALPLQEYIYIYIQPTVVFNCNNIKL